MPALRLMCTLVVDDQPVSMISFAHLSKHRGSRTILRDVSFQAKPGKVAALVGPNGAGKSSALRILLRLDRASSGQALVGGRSYSAHRTPLRVVGAALGGSGAHPSRRAKDHLAWVAATNGIARSRVAQVLEEVGLSEASARFVRGYSLGMAQRLGIAAALLGDPPCLVLDEPTNGLDPEGIRWIRSLVRERAQAGGTVLLSSHLMGELEGMADDIVVLHRGSVLCDAPLDRVVADYGSLEGAYFALTQGAGSAP